MTCIKAVASSPHQHVDTQGDHELFSKDAVHFMLICVQVQHSWLVTWLFGRVSKAEAQDRNCVYLC